MPRLLRERISTTVTSLLGLLGVEADPIKSREHILLSTILDHAWKAGAGPRSGRIDPADPDAAGGQDRRAGSGFVLSLEGSLRPGDAAKQSCWPRRALLPGWKAKRWMSARCCIRQAGKPRIAIFSIAHLSDAERMFFVTLLLNQTLGWMRAQSGTTSLRAILYMDEIFGYFPPVANPPSKAPLLTLLKQARAFGLGVVLATQNPVDLDYKGLANTGTWFIGRLQTERDKARVLGRTGRRCGKLWEEVR